MMPKGGLVATTLWPYLPLFLQKLAICKIMIGKEPSHSECYCCTVLTAQVSACGTHMQHNSPHFLIQYSIATTLADLKSLTHACMYSSHAWRYDRK